MNTYKTNQSFDATQAALEQVYNYYGVDTTDTSYYSDYYSDYNSSYSNRNTNYYSDYDSDVLGIVLAGISAFFVFIVIICIAAIVTAIARWSVFKKANQDGWEALIPVHCDIVEMKLGGIKTYWYFLNLICVPLAIGPIIVSFWKCIKLAHSFGKGTGFGVGLTLLPIVFYPILAWGSAQYIGPQGGSNKEESIFYTESNNNLNNNVNNNANPPAPPVNQPIVTSNDLSSYTDPNVEQPKVEETPIKTENDKTE